MVRVVLAKFLDAGHDWAKLCFATFPSLILNAQPALINGLMLIKKTIKNKISWKYFYPQQQGKLDLSYASDKFKILRPNPIGPGRKKD